MVSMLMKAKYLALFTMITMIYASFSLMSVAQARVQNSNAEATSEDIPLSIQPVVHTDPWAIDWWLPRHEEKLSEIKRKDHDIDLVFLGDSITHNWESKGKEYWQQFYQSRKALNLGFGGDRTEHVLWRLQNGEVEGINPKLLVLMIGTNNTGHRQDPAQETVLGIRKILDELQERLPNTKILMLAIFPRGAEKSDPLRQLNAEINQEIKGFADNKNVFWLNINHMFLEQDGSLPTVVMNDLLHPESEQYKRWAQAIEPYVVRFVDTPNDASNDKVF